MTKQSFLAAQRTKISKSLVLVAMLGGMAVVASAAACTAGDTIFNSVAFAVPTPVNSGYTCTAGSADQYAFSNFELIPVTSPLPNPFSMTLQAGTNAAAAFLDFGFTGVVWPGDFRLVFEVTGLPTGVTLAGATTTTETLCTEGIGDGGGCLDILLGSISRTSSPAANSPSPSAEAPFRNR